MMPRPLRYDDDVVRLSTQGWSAPAIAEHLGIAERTVTRARHRAGISTTYPVISAEDLMLARKILEEGCGYPEASRTIGISIRRIRHRLRGYGNSPSEAAAVAWATRRTNETCLP